MCLLALIMIVVVAAAVLASLCGDGSCSGGEGNPPSAPATADKGIFPPDSTMSPTRESSLSPTRDPTCYLDVDIICYYASEHNPFGFPCDLWEPPVPELQQCEYRPIEAKLFFIGGDCLQSGNRQDLNYTCDDFNGGPPTTEGSEAYIVVTDEDGAGPILFEGIVPVLGEPFVLSNNGNLLGDLQRIQVWMTDQSTLLQEVRGASFTCSDPLELFTRYGANQLVEYYNNEQGSISGFATFSFAVVLRLFLTIRVSVAGESVTLTNLTALTSFAGLLDLTENVSNLTVDSKNPQDITLEGTVDGSTQKNYTLVYNFEGISNPDDSPCSGTDSTSFLFGVSEFDN